MEPALPPLSKKFEWVTEPEGVYAYCKNPNAWKGQPPHGATWETIEDFNQKFPMFHLEGKVDLGGGVMLGPQLYINIIGEVKARKRETSKGGDHYKGGYK